jgi:hypothetical protein
MNIHSILNGSSKIIVSFEEYYTHLDASLVLINLSLGCMQLLNVNEEFIAEIAIGKEAKKQLKTDKIPQKCSDIVLFNAYSVILNGHLNKDWLFVTKDFSKMLD